MRYPTTVTWRVSRRCRVAGTSRIDFTPAQTTVILVRPSASRSADSSCATVHSRCTPPSPPVPNTRMPARAARIAVAETVVAPVTPSAAAGARSRKPSLRTPGSVAIRSRCARSSPTEGTPSTTAIVAGTAPACLTMSSSSTATSRLRGRGRPWEMIVDSRATTGRPAASASATSADTRITLLSDIRDIDGM